MRKALLIADRRTDMNPEDIYFNEAQKLIEKYPVVVAKYFNHRLQKFIKLMNSNREKNLKAKFCTTAKELSFNWELECIHILSFESKTTLPLIFQK